VLADSSTANGLNGHAREGGRATNGSNELTYLDEQLKLALQIRDEVSRLARMVEALRSIKNQLANRNELLKEDAKAEPLIKDSKGLIDKLDVLEAKLHNPKAEVAYDILAQRGGAKLYSILATLFEAVQDGDGSPTQGAQEVYAEEAAKLKGLEAELTSLLADDVAKLNEKAKQLAFPGIVVPSLAPKMAK
jgi:hypothetical protein